jgi:hypothetical protein
LGSLKERESSVEIAVDVRIICIKMIMMMGKLDRRESTRLTHCRQLPVAAFVNMAIIFMLYKRKRIS